VRQAVGTGGYIDSTSTNTASRNLWHTASAPPTSGIWDKRYNQSTTAGPAAAGPAAGGSTGGSNRVGRSSLGVSGARRKTAVPCRVMGCLEFHRNPDGYCHVHRSYQYSRS
jgi:hypothetical protein